MPQSSVKLVRDARLEEQASLISLRTLAVIALIAILVFSWIRPVQSSVDADESPAAKKPVTRKLQIGVKKRAENCQHKSRSGDLLHIHYRVWRCC